VAGSAVDERRAGSSRGAVPALCLVQFVDVLGVTVVVTALPDMLAGVHARASFGGLVATGYAMFFGGLLMFGARLGDRVGPRRTILISLAVFGAGSALTAAAGSIVVLTAGRCFQGAAAAAAVPSALRLLTSVVDGDRQRARAVAAWSASGAAAGASGFVVGGVISDVTSWRVIFWALIGVAVVLGLAVARTVPPDRGQRFAGSLNVAGSVLLTGSVMAVVVGATELAEPDHRRLGALLVGVAVLGTVGLVVVDRRADAPLLPAPLLRAPPLRRGAVGGFLNTATTSSAATLVTLYLQGTLGRSPLAAAATLLPFSLAVVAASALAARILARRSPERVCAAGLAVIAVGEAALIPVSGHVPAMAVCSAVAGFGIGLSSVASTSMGTDVVEADRGAASGIINTTAQVGTAIGVAALLLVAAATSGVPADGTGAPTAGWGVAAAVAAVGAAGFAAVRPSRTAQQPV
jgi:MFS family permease